MKFTHEADAGPCREKARPPYEHPGPVKLKRRVKEQEAAKQEQKSGDEVVV